MRGTYASEPLQDIVLCRWYILALGKGRISVGDELDVHKWRSKFSDYNHKSRNSAAQGFTSFVGSPEWYVSLLVVLLAAMLYAYGMHIHFLRA